MSVRCDFATMQKHAHSMRDAGYEGGEDGRVHEDIGYRATDWMDHPFLSFFFFLSFFNFFLLPATFGFNQRITGSVGQLDRGWVGGWVDGRTGLLWSMVGGGRRTSLKLTLFPCFPRAPFSPGRPGGPVGPSSPFSPGDPACRA